MLLALASLAGNVTPLQAAVPKTCIPPVVGVPGFANGRPNFFDGSQPGNDFQPDWDTSIKQFRDPRWRGAISHDYGANTSDAEFRGLFNNENGHSVLYLSFYSKFAPAIDPANTTLYVGFAPDQVNATGFVLQYTLNSSASVSDEPQQANGTQYYASLQATGSGQSWTQNPAPSWATDNTRVWIKGTNPFQWGFEMRLPVDPGGVNGVPIANVQDFRMWFYFQPDAPVSGGVVGFTPFTWPRTTNNPLAFVYQEIQNGPQTLPVYPDPSTWGVAALKDPAGDANCEGVELTDSEIGTQGTLYQSQMKIWGSCGNDSARPCRTPSDCVGATSCSAPPANVFFANPVNKSSTVTVPANTMTATFKLANWGSQVGDDTATSWTPIPPGPGTQGPAVLPGNSANITQSWTLNQTDRCPFIGQAGTTDNTGHHVPGDPGCLNVQPTLELHQCMVVKLNAPGIDFIRDSAFKNMDFVGASDFNRGAEIRTVPGVKSVYLYVETLNMPSVAETTWKTVFNRIFGEPGKRSDEQTRAALGKMTAAEVRQTVPTYIVHVYYDTGKTVTIKGVTHPILLPQVSFGYFVLPHADVAGWVSTLEGATKIKGGNNLYKIDLPASGIARISTKVSALEKLPKDCFGHIKTSATFVLMIGMVVVGIIVYRRPRRLNDAV